MEIMRYNPLHILLLGLAPATTFAAPDASYNASLPFRPNNVTGLDPIYNWVGSYYNATTQIEINPLLGATANQSACDNVRNKSFTFEFTSFLAITERGPYDNGSNPVNTLLTLWQTDTNFSGLSELAYSSPSLKWYLESTPWVDHVSGNGLAYDDFGIDRSVQDVFNLTLASTTTAPYNLTGIIKESTFITVVENLKVDLPSCDPSTESREYYVSLIERSAPNVDGSNWTYPVVSLQFDSKTANFTLEGYFVATPLIQKLNVTVLEGAESIQGKIKIAFSGVIDPYHSDLLVNNSATPAWLRTVGFNNDTLNIGYNSGGPQNWPRREIWSFSAIIVLISILVLSI